MAKKHLQNAQKAKKDEFYTQYYDIASEIEAYLDYNPDLFRDKTVLLPCDDPEWSNFTKFFAQNFEWLGLKKLISTSFAAESKDYNLFTKPTEYEINSAQYDALKSKFKGKIFVLERDITGDGKINYDDIEWNYLNGDGDFRSPEVIKLRNEADIIVTNPPFSIFRQFFSWIMEANKKFLIVSNKNCITYKEVYPYIMTNSIWVGYQPMGKDMLFDVPDALAEEILQNSKKGSKYRIVNGKVMARSTSCWMTNIEHGKRHEFLQLMTMEDNLRYSKHKDLRGKNAYSKYDNCDAIEIPYYDAIPSDYDGVMGVPITFLDKYCPEQFEIVGFRKGDDGNDLSLDGAFPYFRILIKKVK